MLNAVRRQKKRVMLFVIFLWLLFVSPLTANAQNIATKETILIDLKTDGKVNQVVYSDQYAFAGGIFNTAEIVESKQLLNKRNFVVIDRYRKTFPLRQLPVNGQITTMIDYADDLYLLGDFSQVDYQKRQRAAIIDMPSLTLLPAKIDADKKISIAKKWNKLLIIGGSFTKINQEKRYRLAVYDTQRYQLAPWTPVLNGDVTSAALQDSLLIVGGAFTKADDQARAYLAVYDLNTGQLSGYTHSLKAPVTALSVSKNQLAIRTSGSTSPIVVPIAKIQKTVTAGVTGRVQLSSSASGANVLVGITGGTADPLSGELMIDSQGLGFQIPTLSTILTFAIRAFFAIAGLTALFYMLLGGMNWVMSGGDKDAITAAREKIQSAVIGLILMVVVLSVIWTLEQIVFKRRICLGLSCSITLPSLLENER